MPRSPCRLNHQTLWTAAIGGHAGVLVLRATVAVPSSATPQLLSETCHFSTPKWLQSNAKATTIRGNEKWLVAPICRSSLGTGAWPVGQVPGRAPASGSCCSHECAEGQGREMRGPPLPPLPVFCIAPKVPKPVSRQLKKSTLTGTPDGQGFQKRGKHCKKGALIPEHSAPYRLIIAGQRFRLQCSSISGDS